MMTAGISWSRIGLFVLVGLGIAAALWWGLWPSGDDRVGLRYDTASVERGTLTRGVTASGTVEAVITVEVGSQLSGQVAAIYVDFNDPVTEGQRLALIDPQTFETRVASAEADLAVARSGVAVQEATVQRAEAVRDQAVRERDRQRALAARGNVSQTVLDNAETAVVTAQADLAIARSQLDNAQSVVIQRDAALAQARIDLERTQIRSPIDGVVISRDVDVGQTVAASLQAPILFTIAQDLSRIQIAAEVNEADVGAIAEGNPVRFTVDAFPERRFSGAVRQVRLAATALQNVVTYTVIVEASNPGQRLFPGMTATVEIITGVRADVLRLPAAALRFVPPGSEPARGPGRAFAALAEILAHELDLTAAQRAALDEALSDGRQRRAARRAQGGGSGAGMPGGGGAGGDPEARRGRMLDRLERLLRASLTPAQAARLTDLRPLLESGRPGTVWVLTSAGALERRAVLTGLSDGTQVEILAGPVTEGTAVVVRAVSGEGRP